MQAVPCAVGVLSTVAVGVTTTIGRIRMTGLAATLGSMAVWVVAPWVVGARAVVVDGETVRVAARLWAPVKRSKAVR